MLRAVTGARSVGSEVHLRNQTSGESIGRTSWDVASMFLSFFRYDLRNAIQLAKLGGGALMDSGEFIFKCDFGHLSDFAELTTGAALSGSVKYPQRLSGTLGAHTEEINDE